jgi:ankyrin repeat protein
MSADQLPERPDLDQLRRLAKELRDAARAGDQAALDRVRRHLGASADALALTAAQHAIAREHGFPSWPRLRAAVTTSLHDAVEANDVALVRLLLERGADADDGHALSHAVEHRDHECLRLLIEHGARVQSTGALSSLVGRDDVEGVRILLTAGADPGRPHPAVPAPAGILPDMTENPLPAAAQRDSAAVVEALLEAGADPDAPCRDGRSPLCAAARRGAGEVVAVLLGHGARDDVEAADRFLGACARADRADAERLLAQDPGLVMRLTDEDAAVVVAAAESGRAEAVRVMVELGFPLDARRGSDGAAALHAAAYMGRADVVRLLIDGGADVERRDGQFDSTPLCWAAVGSGERPRGEWPADWAATVQVLLAAGASTAGAIVETKPPSADVAALLRPTGKPEPAPPPEPAADPALLDEIARRLRVAFESGDAELLESLLHPDVRWGAGPRACWNRAQVLEWYGVLRDRRGSVHVTRTRARGDEVVLRLSGEGHGERSQTFRVAGGSIVEIRG